MNKRKINISTLEELEAEERVVRKRIKLQEVELRTRLKQLPEEFLTTAISRVVSEVIKGSALKSVINFAKRVGKNVFSNILKEFV